MSAVRCSLYASSQVEGRLGASRSGAVSASIDSSDGLAWSLHGWEMSNVGFIVHSVPVADEVRRFESLTILILWSLCFMGGEKYESVGLLSLRLVDAETAVEAVGGCLCLLESYKDRRCG